MRRSSAMNPLIAVVIPLALLAACDDDAADQSRAAPESETQAENEPAVGNDRPDVINRTETAEDLGEASNEALAPATSGGGEPSDPAYVGVWAANIDWCGNTNGPEVPIEITETTFGGYENQCEIADITAQRDDEWEATLNCTGEGTSETRRITLSARENTLVITYHDIDDQGISYHRCVPAAR